MSERETFEGFLKSENFRAARQMLVNKITAAILEWRPIRINGRVLEVCLPVRVKGPDEKMYYVPVTPSETWSFARQFNALPLTSAVFDLYDSQSIYVQRSLKHDASNPTGNHFHTFSEYLNNSSYHTAMKSGAHKLWILSSVGRSVNRGLYFPKPKDPYKYKNQGGFGGPTGRNDSTKWVTNIRGLAHGESHWDYSQLLQLMRSDNFASVKEIEAKTLRQAVLNGEGEVWDEPTKMKPEFMP